MALKIDLELIIKSFEQDTSIKMVDSRLVVKEPPGEKILEKMVENSYLGVVKINGKPITQAVYLAPPKVFFLKNLLIPPINLNVVSDDMKKKVRNPDGFVY